MPADLPVGIGVVLIGRNEGERLVRALARVPPIEAVIYVDSGSNDGSVAAARSRGFPVLELSEESAFSAARARNEGLAHLQARNPAARYVQMLDGDCELDVSWLRVAALHLDADDECAVVFGRCRELAPDSSMYNALCDLEWRAPLGEVASSGGNAMFRADALSSVGGFDVRLAAGEEPDLCHRLRKAGWVVVSLPDEMVVHDAGLTRFQDWWRRAQRSGYAYAQLSDFHGADAEPNWTRSLRSIAIWAVALPFAIVLAAAAWWSTREVIAAFAVCAMVSLYPLQVIRIARREWQAGVPRTRAWQYAGFLILGKFAEAVGWLRFRLQSARRLSSAEYRYEKSAGARGRPGSAGKTAE